MRVRKLPSREQVVKLYLEDGLSTQQIARMYGVSDPHTVRQQLLRAGIRLRRHTVTSFCIEPGCGQPVARTLHKKLNVQYGKRCAMHQQQHRRKVCSDWAKRFSKANPEVVAHRYNKWIMRLRNMTPEQLCHEIKEKPCQFKKAELLRKIRKLQRAGRYEEVLQMIKSALPTLLPKMGSREPTT